MQRPATAAQCLSPPVDLDLAAEGLTAHAVMAGFACNGDLDTLAIRLRGVAAGSLRWIGHRFAVGELLPVLTVIGYQQKTFFTIDFEHPGRFLADGAVTDPA